MIDDTPQTVRTKLLNAALVHVAFDGWTDATFTAAARDADVDLSVARAMCPAGAVDLAKDFHRAGDAQMIQLWVAADTDALKIREKVTLAVKLRLQAASDKEAVRRGTTLFALPHHAGDGAKLIWGTADAIWTLLGDTSDDVNWYTKRATLAGVYGSTVLFWLGDDSLDHQATWDFLDRRIANVMQIEQIKAQVRATPALNRLLAGPRWFADRIKAPNPDTRTDLPGTWPSR